MYTQIQLFIGKAWVSHKDCLGSKPINLSHSLLPLCHAGTVPSPSLLQTLSPSHPYCPLQANTHPLSIKPHSQTPSSYYLSITSLELSHLFTLSLPLLGQLKAVAAAAAKAGGNAREWGSGAWRCSRQAAIQRWQPKRRKRLSEDEEEEEGDL